MNDDCSIVATVEKKSPISSPPLKKLKQSRLPFAPVNSKSPKETEAASSDKKRKYSGSDDVASTPKTPRAETKAATPGIDENQVTPKVERSVKSAESEDTKEGSVKKRGRPPGAKNTPKDKSVSSPKDESSPTPKKRGRPIGSKASSSKLNQSLEVDKNSQGNDEKSEASENTNKSASKMDVDGASKGSPNKSTNGKNEMTETEDDNKSQDKVEEIGKKQEGESTNLSVDVKTASKDTDDKPKKTGKKRGRPLGARSKSEDGGFSSSQDESSPAPKKRGRPAGSKNSKSNLNKSLDVDKSVNGEEDKATPKKLSEVSQSKSNETEDSLVGDTSNLSCLGAESEGEELEDSILNSSVDVKEDGTDEVVVKKRGRPKRSLTPGDKDSPRGKPGRPKGAKNKKNNLLSPDTTNDGSSQKTPVEKTRKLLSLFASVSSSTKKESPKAEKTLKSWMKPQVLEQEGNKDTGKSQQESSESSGSTEILRKQTSGGSGDAEESKTLVDGNNSVDKNTKKKDMDKSNENTKKKDVDKSNENTKKKDVDKSDEKTRKDVDKSDEKTKKKDVDKSDENTKKKDVDKSDEKTKKDVDKSDEKTKKKDVDKSDEKTKKKDVDKSDENTKKKDVDKSDESTKKKDVDKSDENTKKEDVGKSNENTKKKDVDKSDDTCKVEMTTKEKELDLAEDVEKKVDSNPKECKDAGDTKMKEMDDDNAIEETKEKDNLNDSKFEDLDESKVDLDQSVNDQDVSSLSIDESLNKTMSPDSRANTSTSSKIETPTSLTPKSHFFAKPKKLTPKQKEKEAARQLKMEEREKQKQEKEKLLQEKLAEKERLRLQKEEERQKQKEDKEKTKEELRKKRQEEIDAKKQKKEEELQKKEDEKLKKQEEQQKKDEEKKKKLEEQQKKDEEKKKKEEEKKKKEEEKKKKQEEQQKKQEEKRSKFASFFVAKKKEQQEEEMKNNEGLFQEFRVKEDMMLAPTVRHILSEDQIKQLDELLLEKKQIPKTYLKTIKSPSYVKGRYDRTGPSKKEMEVDDDDDDILVLDNDDGDDDDDDVGDCSAMIQDAVANKMKSKRHRAKLLAFCENRRPAYWGTWSKTSTKVCARRPLAKDAIFDYEYDSDDDWEEEEAGESLSDSEGEDKEEKEEDQYEVDNDFFVPHGYLSDDEGKSDEEEEEENDNGAEESQKSKETDRSRNTEQLKQKQAEFEEEMKKKTKQLKPRLIGCLWMADQNNNHAYEQLMKVLVPYKAVTLGTTLPIGGRNKQGLESKDAEADDDEGTPRVGNSKKFVKSFPEEAIPALIKLIHGNRHGKSKLCNEFVNYWKKLTNGELEESMINNTPNKITASESVHISKRKAEMKIQELGCWKRCQENGSRYIMCWYVSKKIREEHGMGDLELPNNWMYVNSLKKESKKEEMDTEEDPPKSIRIRPITAFTTKIPSTPSSTNSSPGTTPNTTPLPNHLKVDASPMTVTPANSKLKTPVVASSSTNTGTKDSSSKKHSESGKKTGTESGKKAGRRVALFPVKNQQETSGPSKGSIASFFKKGKGNSQGDAKVKKDDDGDIEMVTLD